MIKIENIIRFFVVFILGTTSVFAQNTSFHVVDNLSVGLTAANYEKFGSAIADIDGNGYPDICCTRWGGVGFSHIFINNGGTFQDISDQTPLESIEGDEESKNTYTPLWVDFDNDGDKDLCFSTTTTLHLLQNDDNVFSDVAQELGFVSSKPPGFIMEYDVHPGAWGDYDLDGDLDFIASQLNNPNVYLLRNDDGHFTNVATEAGLDDTEMTQSWSLSFDDVDLDGDVDIYSKHTFYLNENGYFTNASETMGINDDFVTNYREMFDYDNDGDLDYIRVNSATTEDPSIQLWENQNGTFTDISQQVGLSLFMNSTRSITIGDVDNDGDQDVFVHNNQMEGYDLLLVNEEVEPGVRVFADISNFIGINVEGDRKGGGFFDYNMDGFLDIYVASAVNHVMFHNDGNDYNWLGLILQGTTSNRDAVGSIVTLYNGDTMQIRTQKCGNHVANQNNPFIHFGIGESTNIDSVVIRWPSGIRQVLTGLDINQYHNILESDDTSIAEQNDSAMPASFSLAQNYPNPFNPQTRIDFHVGSKGLVSLDIYNLIGEKVATIVNNVYSAGQYSVVWDGRDFNRNKLPSGVYMYCLKSGDLNQTKKMVLMQ